MTNDRPFWPPRAEVEAQAWDAYAAWERRWSEDLEEVEDVLERTRVYSYMSDGIDVDLAKAMAKSDARLMALSTKVHETNENLRSKIEWMTHVLQEIADMGPHTAAWSAPTVAQNALAKIRASTMEIKHD